MFFKTITAFTGWALAYKPQLPSIKLTKNARLFGVCLVYVALGVYSSSSEARPGSSEEDRQGRIYLSKDRGIPGRFFVRIAGGVSRSYVYDLVARSNGTVEYDWLDNFRLLSVSMPARSARSLSSSTYVDYVEQVGTFEDSVPESSPFFGHPTERWHLDRIDEPSLPTNGLFFRPNDGSGVTVYVIDYGVFTSHVEFNGVNVSFRDFLIEPGGSSELSVPLCDYHGTSVASAVAGVTSGVSPGVRLKSLRVWESDACGGEKFQSTEAVVDALNYVLDDAFGPSIVNMSLGFPKDIDELGRSLTEVVEAVMDQGVLVVAAAGNWRLTPIDENGEPGPGDPITPRKSEHTAQNELCETLDDTSCIRVDNEACGWIPGNIPGVITVTSSDKNDGFAPKANHGTCVDIVGPGEGVTTARFDGQTTVLPNEYGEVSGTSFAAPVVAGVLAQIFVDNPGVSSNQARDILLDLAISGQVSCSFADCNCEYYSSGLDCSPDRFVQIPGATDLWFLDAQEEDDSFVQARAIPTDVWVDYNFIDDENDWIDISALVNSIPSDDRYWAVTVFIDSRGSRLTGADRMCAMGFKATTGEPPVQHTGNCDTNDGEADVFGPGQFRKGTIVKFPWESQPSFDSYAVRLHTQSDTYGADTNYRVRVIVHSCASDETPCNGPDNPGW